MSAIALPRCQPSPAREASTKTPPGRSAWRLDSAFLLVGAGALEHPPVRFRHLLHEMKAFDQRRVLGILIPRPFPIDRHAVGHRFAQAHHARILRRSVIGLPFLVHVTPPLRSRRPSTPRAAPPPTESMHGPRVAAPRSLSWRPALPRPHDNEGPTRSSGSPPRADDP